MSDAHEQVTVESYKFYHKDVSKCSTYKEYSCGEACFRGIYEVTNKGSTLRCVVVEDLSKCKIRTLSGLIINLTYFSYLNYKIILEYNRGFI
ncbi:MAG: hypothetical protein ACFFG0_27155 [Candidatus Thorarchaeota archaeon]